MRRVAVYGAAFNPPGTHQRAIAAAVAARVDELFIVPCGPRPDSKTLSDTPPIHRASMADLTFSSLPKTVVDLFDLDLPEYTRTGDLQTRYSRPSTMVTHVLVAETLERLRTQWDDGPALWNSLHFTVVHRPGEIPEHLPPACDLLALDYQDRAALIRAAAVNDEPFGDDLLAPAVQSYLERHGLYRPAGASARPTLAIASPKLELHPDPRNPESVALAASLANRAGANPDLIVPIGGDGTMLRAIREHWRRRIPFLGLNTGHVGFLLNDPGVDDIWSRSLRVHLLPMLKVRMERLDGSVKEGLAFNDAWVERATGQSAWLKLTVDGELRVREVVGDGLLVSTAAGSTCYARAMGAAPVPFTSPVLILVGSNLLRPTGWRPTVLPLSAHIDVESLDPAKRPLTGFIDGAETRDVRRMSVQLSNIAAAELAFAPGHDLASKLYKIQFPSE
jgi:NAD kinase/nicotinic acid mononucleotide adenylyltransferase